MQWRIGLLGLGLVAAFVVGGSADQPSPTAPPVNQNGQSVEQYGDSAGQYGDSAGQHGDSAGQHGERVQSLGQELPPGMRGMMPPPQARVPSGLAQMQSSSPDLGSQVGAAGELIGFNGFDGSGSQTITLVHTGKMQMAVYHIDRSGIHLVSSRPIDADFSLSLNVTAPLPSQIRLLGGQVK